MQCPECETQNPDTNLFCPMCGHSFFDDHPHRQKNGEGTRDAAEPAERGDGRPASGRKRPKSGKALESNRTFVIVTVIVVIILGLGAGITSFFVSREIERSSLVEVQSGTTWKCAGCGKEYKDRVVTLEVKKSDRYQYGTETINGLCYACKYGPMVGGYQDVVEALSTRGYFAGYRMEIPDALAAYMNANQALFPAADPTELAEGAIEADPRLIERDFEDYIGRSVAVRGKVLTSSRVPFAEGSRGTYLEIKPIAGDNEVDDLFLVIYEGAAPVLAGDQALFYLAPCDQLVYKTAQGDRKAILSIGMGIVPESAGGTPSSTPQN